MSCNLKCVTPYGGSVILLNINKCEYRPTSIGLQDHTFIEIYPLAYSIGSFS